MALSRMLNPQQTNSFTPSFMPNNDVPDLLGINVKKPKFPQYSMLKKREESFTTWPNSHPLSPKDLAEAGLVFTGNDDSVRCYYCGGGLKNWDVGDCAWVEHAKWYPTCPHIQLVKGADFIRRVAEGTIQTEEDAMTPIETPQIQSPIEPWEDFLKAPAAESCILMGYDREIVKNAIKEFFKKKNNLNFTATELAEISEELEYENQKEKLRESSEPDFTHLGKPASKSEHEHSAEPMTIDNEPEKVTINDDNVETDSPEELLRENQRLKELKQCKICLDALSSVIFLPCGHMVSCPQCAPALPKCPICRVNIKGTVRAHFA